MGADSSWHRYQPIVSVQIHVLFEFWSFLTPAKKQVQASGFIQAAGDVTVS